MMNTARRTLLLAGTAALALTPLPAASAQSAAQDVREDVREIAPVRSAAAQEAVRETASTLPAAQAARKCRHYFFRNVDTCFRAKSDAFLVKKRTSHPKEVGVLAQTSYGRHLACGTTSKRKTCRYKLKEKHTNGAPACVRWRPYEKDRQGRVAMGKPSRSVSIRTGNFLDSCWFPWR